MTEIQGPRGAIKGEFFDSQVAVDKPTASFLGALGGGRVAAGVQVTPDSAMRSAAVWACVQAISQDCAKVRPMLKRRASDGSAQAVVNHPVAGLLLRPNSWQTWFEYAQFQFVNKLLRGNAYAVKVRDRAQNVRALIPVRADEVSIYEGEGPDGAGELFYDISPQSDLTRRRIGGAGRFSARDVHHIRGMSLDGICGLSPIGYAREGVGLALAAETFGAKLFGNGARPSGVIEVPEILSDDAVKRMKSSWEAAHAGVQNAHKTAVLEQGAKWRPLTMTSEDAQFLETRKFQVSDIARIYRVPPHKIGDLEKATFSNIESQSLEYYNDCLMPHFESFEQAMARDLLQDPRLFIDHDVRQLLRGDIQGRFAAYATGRQWGWLSANDILKSEGDNPIANGDIYLQPMNMVPAGTEPAAQEGADDDGPEDEAI